MALHHRAASRPAILNSEFDSHDAGSALASRRCVVHKMIFSISRLLPNDDSRLRSSCLHYEPARSTTFLPDFIGHALRQHSPPDMPKVVDPVRRILLPCLALHAPKMVVAWRCCAFAEELAISLLALLPGHWIVWQQRSLVPRVPWMVALVLWIRVPRGSVAASPSPPALQE